MVEDVMDKASPKDPLNKQRFEVQKMPTLQSLTNSLSHPPNFQFLPSVSPPLVNVAVQRVAKSHVSSRSDTFFKT